jgi:hypothetical protein
MHALFYNNFTSYLSKLKEHFVGSRQSLTPFLPFLCLLVQGAPTMPCFYLKPKQDDFNQIPELQVCIAEALYDADSIVADPEAYKPGKAERTGFYC